MEKVKKGWQTIAKMGDKTLKSTTFNREYKSILDAQQGVLKTIGTLSNLKIMQSTKREELEMVKEASFDSLSPAQKVQMYKLLSKGMDLPYGSPAFKKNKAEIDKLRKKLKLDEGENVDRVKEKQEREKETLAQRHADEMDDAKEKDFKDAQDEKKRERMRDEASDEVMATKEKIYKDLKKKRKYFEKEYGKEKADDIMHGTAMNMAKKQHKVAEGKFKTELSKQFALEALSMQQRRAIAMRMRRQAQKIARKRMRNKKRMKSQDQLLKKAQKMARDTLAKKMTGGKSLSTLSIGARIAIAKKLDKKKSAITRLAKKMLPKVKKGEVERLKKFRAQQSDKK